VFAGISISGGRTKAASILEQLPAGGTNFSHVGVAQVIEQSLALGGPQNVPGGYRTFLRSTLLTGALSNPILGRFGQR
jgi:hypothetical protein